MTPSDKPFDSANEPENTQNNPPLSSPSSDAAALQAIEALEAESNQLPETPDEISSPAPSSPSAPQTPEVITPEAPKTPTPAPSASTTDMSSTLNEEPAAPTSSEFQPFTAKKTGSKKIIIIIVAILLAIGLGVGGYFGWQYLQSQNNTTVPTRTTVKEGAEDEATPVTNFDDPATNAITEIETELDAIEDTEYNDDTLSDETLYN